LMLGLPHINSCDFERNEHQSAAADAGVQATSETEPLAAAPKPDLSIVCLPPPSEGRLTAARDEDRAALLAHAAAIAANGNDLVAVEQGVEDGGGEDGIAERSVRRWAILTAIPMRRQSLRAISSSTRKAKASKSISRRAASSIRQSSWSQMAANCSRISQPASGGLSPLDDRS
jgi:hypothetical protein